ncbi:MAG: sensor histidine kinase [Gammaproteobacteria bacterium]|nr:sensor histidine kinase [Gammaproteobacteria bacterium]MBU1441295.1 sensor histidine kinase [Gammaproteobacteria bacterium]MBU2286172.1 sensor histidine kinase [Gammaproteobacteria bacterium]MBU2407078.1 sensor histidine kinase [Gammaproteobacteria bacterium]
MAPSRTKEHGVSNTIESSLPSGAGAGALPGDRFDDGTGLKNMEQLIQLRWIAVMGQVATIAVVHFGFDIQLPLEQLAIVLGGLVAFNIVSHLRCRTRRRVTNTELLVALLVDVFVLTLELYLTGGATNPFVYLYLLQVILGAVLLKTWSIWTMVAVTVACFMGLALFSRPLALAFDPQDGLASPYILGTLICFALNAALLVTFVTRISRNLRARDAHLADLRQRAAEEEHIVRMGLLASGAAHELGTPLATLSVILGDWRRMPTFQRDPELLQEADEMQAQLRRCKAIVSGILLSAGEARGESSARTTVRTFLDDLVGEWRATRTLVAFEYDNRFGHDLPMVSDSTLKQMIGNVLDNALEASPDWLRLVAERVGDELVLCVADAGPGFAPEMLTQFGKPYRSTKGRPGGGLGLFLVVNVARTLGGTVSARNLEGGGAEVRVSLPLAAITLEGDPVGS